MAWGPAGKWTESEILLTSTEVQSLREGDWGPVKEFLKDLQGVESVYLWREGNRHRFRFGYRVKFGETVLRSMVSGGGMS